MQKYKRVARLQASVLLHCDDKTDRWRQSLRISKVLQTICVIFATESFTEPAFTSQKPFNLTLIWSFSMTKSGTYISDLHIVCCLNHQKSKSQKLNHFGFYEPTIHDEKSKHENGNGTSVQISPRLIAWGLLLCPFFQKHSQKIVWKLYSYSLWIKLCHEC